MHALILQRILAQQPTKKSVLFSYKTIAKTSNARHLPELRKKP